MASWRTLGYEELLGEGGLALGTQRLTPWAVNSVAPVGLLRVMLAVGNPALTYRDNFLSPRWGREHRPPVDSILLGGASCKAYVR